MNTLEVLEKVLKGKRIKSGTQRHYREALTSLSRYSEDWPVSGILINEWLATLDNYSDTLVRMWYAVVNSAGRYMERAYGLENPCKTAESPRVSKKRRRYFTALELMKILEATRNEIDRALVYTLVDSTCRIGELEGLSGKMVGDAWLDVKGKTGERRYRLDERLCVILKKLSGGDDEPVFKNNKGGAQTVGVLKNRVRRVIREAGISGSKVGAHTLRRSGASLVAQKTGSALAVKALLQHDDIQTSMGYIHDAEDYLQQRISVLSLIGDEVFGGMRDIIEPEQKKLTDGSEKEMGAEAVESEVAVVEGEIVDYLTEAVPVVLEGVEVRPLLKTVDLRLLREAIIGYCRSGFAGRSEVELIHLMRRMLRKVR